MNLKTLLPLAFLAAIGGSSLVTTNTGCDQQAAKCTSARGEYFVRYAYVSGAESCKDLKGEAVGFQTYNAVGEFGKPDLDRASIAMVAEGIGNLVDNAAAGGVTDTDPNDKEYSLGSFNSAEPVGDFCTVPTLSIAQQQLAAVEESEDDGTTAQPATLINYEWKNVRIYVTPQYFGTQFQADLTVGGDAGDCVYKAQGLYPSVGCKEDADCNPEPAPPERPTGSGINPDVSVRCDTELAHCVPTSSAFPAFR